MSGTLIDRIIATLASAGADGMKTSQVAASVSATLGRTVPEKTVYASIASYRCTYTTGPRLCFRPKGRIRLWYLGAAEAEAQPEAAPLRPDDSSIRPRSLTAALFGDPLPGRSAYDQREFERARRHA